MGAGLVDRQRLTGRALTGLGLLVLAVATGLVGATAVWAEGVDQLVVEHSADTDRIEPGDTVTYTVRLDNSAGGSIEALTLVIDIDETTLDPSTAVIIPSPGGNGLGSGLVLADNRFTATDLSVGAGQALTVVYTVTARPDVLSGLASRNLVRVTDDDGVTVEASVEVALIAATSLVALEHTVIDNNGLLSPGEHTSYRVTIRNNSSVAIPGATLSIQRDAAAFTELVSESESLELGDDGQLRSPPLELAPGRTRSFTYIAVAGADASPEPNASNEATLEVSGSPVTKASEPLPVAAPLDAVQISHTIDDESGPVDPGGQVGFTITITNTSGAGRPVENLSVAVQQTDASVVSEIWTTDPDDPGERIQPAWTLPRLEAGAVTKYRYAAQVRSELGADPSVPSTEAIVSTSGDGRTEPGGVVNLVTAGEMLVVAHTAETEELVAGGEVTFVLTVKNNHPTTEIENLELRAPFDANAFQKLVGEPVSQFALSENEGALVWATSSLAPEREVVIRYRAIALPELPDTLASVQINATVKATGVDTSKKSPVVRVSDAAATRDSASIEGSDLFVLVILFLLISFLTGSYVILSRRLGTRNSETGVYIFTTVTLVSAVLVLAFGTTVAEEGALSLLAAVAGYVLGRRFGDDGRRTPPATGPQVLTEGGDGEGGGGDGGGEGVARPQAVAVAFRPTLADQVRQSTEVARASRVHTWVLVAIPLLSPVLLVISVLWLLDSTGSSVARDTYVSSAAITVLMLIFVGVVGYLLLGGTDRSDDEPAAAAADGDAEAEEPDGQQQDG